MLVSLFFLFLVATFMGFGGAQGVLPVLYEHLVSIKGFMTPQEFTNLIGISQLTPGPILVNSATYVGLKVAGLSGSVVTTLGVILPSFLILSIAMWLRHTSLKIFNIIKEGLRPLALSLLFLGLLTLLKNVLYIEDVIVFKSLGLIGLGLFLVKTWRVSSLYIFSVLGFTSIILDFLHIF